MFVILLRGMTKVFFFKYFFILKRPKFQLKIFFFLCQQNLHKIKSIMSTIFDNFVNKSVIILRLKIL